MTTIDKITRCIKFRQILILAGILGVFQSVKAGEVYHINRTFTPVEFNLQGVPPVDLLNQESEKLTDTVRGDPIVIDSNGTYAIEQQAAIALGYSTAEAAWNAAIIYQGTPSNYPGKIFDNVGWVRGTKSSGNDWGAYLWVLQNRIAFQSSTSVWWKASSNGVPVMITNVIVGSLGNYAPMSNVVDIGPHLDAATNNFPGANQSESRTFYVDITNVFYQLSIPDIFITPNYAVTNVGGSDVQDKVTGTNIPNGVTWAITPSGLTSGAVIQASNDWHFASVTPGNIATNYKIRATSVDNTNFYDEADLVVVGMQSLQYKIGTNSLTDMPDTLYVCKDTTVNFKAIKVPDSAPWPGGKPVWGDVVSGSGVDSNSYTFSTISTSATDYKVVSAECGNTITGKVIVFNVEVTNIKFNWDTASSSYDAINIRQDYTNAYDISNGEWVKGVTNIPACYTVNKSAEIKARFTVQPAGVTSADIWATAIVGGSLGDVLKTNVAFSGGVSDYVTFRIFDTMPDCIQKTASDVWQWRMENVNGNGSAACDLNTSGVHTVYTILAEPVSPWVNTAGSQKNTWTKALDFDIESASCDGDSTASDALTHITQYLHSGHGLTYDINGGAPAYASSTLGGTFELTEYIDKTGGDNVYPPRADNIVNCYDQAGGVCTLGHLLGISVTYRFMRPFGYINTVNLVGEGNCNNPFYPMSTSQLKIAGADDVSPVRMGFGNHAFTVFGGNVFDACAGPNVGTRTEAQYVSDAVDTSTPAEAAVAGTTSNISSGAVTDIR
ncbi:MAG: hypothetical protein PHW60_01730 [Kiritimatiellae bacterium]|nr:hypothetical protein [Kiritimatiellia bacterium]